jgi:hypothetical protein
MADAAAPPPERPEPPENAITVTLTYSGSEAEVLRTLALLEGRSAEEVALDRISQGIPITFASPLGEDPDAMAALGLAMFDGPSDLAERSGEDLFRDEDR